LPALRRNGGYVTRDPTQQVAPLFPLNRHPEWAAHFTTHMTDETISIGGGQRQRSFDATDAPKSDIGATAAAPTVNTTPYKETAAQYTNNGSPLAQIGQSLNSFFRSGAQTIGQIEQVQQQVDLTDIDRENQNLKLQGGIDYKGGKPMAPEYANRQAYAGAYQQASADNHAFELAEGFKKVLADMPRDGTQDPMAAAQAYWKSQIGSGTGNRDYDAQLMGKFTQNVNMMVGQADNQKIEDQERLATNAIMQKQANRLQSQNGVTPGDVADMRGELLTVTHGDVVKADVLLGTIAGSVQNQTQGLSFLNALATPDSHDGSSWASRNEMTYQKLSSKVLDQSTKIKSIEAYNEVSRWKQDEAALNANPNATAADWARLIGRATDIDFRHGTGTEPFMTAFAGMSKFVKQKANVNLQYESMMGTIGGAHRMDAYEAAAGRNVTETERNQGYTQFVQKVPGFEALRDTAGQDGLLNPAASPAAMAQFADLFSAQATQQTHMGSLMTKDIKQRAFGGLTSTDPAAAAISYQGAARMERNMGGSLPPGVFPSPEAEQMYRSMKGYMADGTDAVTAFKTMKEDPIFQKYMAKGQESGQYALADLINVHGGDATKLMAQLQTGLVALSRENSDRAGIPMFRKDVGMSPTMKSEYMGLLYRDAAIQLTNSSKYDAKLGLANVQATMAGRTLVIPAMNGNLQVIENRWGDQGQNVNNPLNVKADGLIPTSRGFDPVYSGVPMINKLGQREDPQATLATDVDALAKAFPSVNGGKGLDTKGAWFSPPDDNGLMQLKLRNGQPMQFATGQTVDLPVNVTRRDWLMGGTKSAVETKATVIPKDPVEAAKFMHDHLPPGWFAVRDGQDGMMTLKYGFRILGDDEAAAKAGLLKEFQRDADNSATNQRLDLKKGYTSAGGAAMGITPSQRGHAPTGADPATRAGDWLSENIGPNSGRGIGGFN
jgi:hypothetical protein